MDKLPFSVDMPLSDCIKDRYLINALKWIGDFKDSDSRNLLGVKTGSIWGVAYSLICLLQAKHLYIDRGEFPGSFDTKADNAILFLVDKGSHSEDTCNWDGNVWDTSVVCRALVHYLCVYSYFDQKEKVVNTVIKALSWLHKQIEARNYERYSLGIPDLSQILRTLLLAKKMSSQIFEKKQIELFTSESLDKLINKVVNEIINSVEIKKQICDGESEEIAIWDDDIFASADAIISLSEFLSLDNFPDEYLEYRTKIVKLLQPALRYLELEQIDGRWGIEETTTISLHAYIIGSKVLGDEHIPEAQIVFKAIRYLCDPKTVFSDGSIAHKMEPTVYMILAFIEVIENWDLPNNIISEKSIQELYDYVIWRTPTNATHERIKRYQAQSETNLLRAEAIEKNKTITRYENLIIRYKTIGFLVIWILVGILNSALFKFILFPSPEKSFMIGQWIIPSWEVLLAFLTLWGGLGWFVYDRILHINRIPNGRIDNMRR